MGADHAALIGAAVAFVGSHMLLSGPLRRPLRRLLGERGFLLAYSLVAFATLGTMIWAFDRAEPGEPLWDGTALVPWIIASALTVIALALFLGSFNGNPALPQANLAGLSARKAWGAFTITRHPMMMAFALWALAHMLVAPTLRTLILAGAVMVLALAGSHQQDRRKRAEARREWETWMARTSFWPRWRALPALGVWWPVAILLWLAVTWAHIPLGHVPAGLWRWVNAG
jgi:uncharacterized membrane protein